MTLRNWIVSHPQFIHSIKTAFAVLIGFVITKSVHFPVDQWLIITILVVMCAQMNVGGMIQKSYMRFLGTLTGSIIAILTLSIFGNNHVIASAIIVTCSAMLFSYVATSEKSFSESGTLGAVTVVIILIGQQPTVGTAAGRFLEISLGILIAGLISQLIFPIHARQNLRHIQAKTIRQLREYYQLTLISPQRENTFNNSRTFDERIIKSLIDQRKLSSEAMREPFKKNYSLTRFKQLLWCEKEILRSIIFMYHAYHASPQIYELFSTMSVLNHFHKTACDTLDNIADFFEKNESEINTALPDILPIKEAISSTTKILNSDNIIYAHSFLFSAEILIARMKQLISI